MIAHRFWAHRQVRGRVGNRHTRSWSGLSWNSAELRICFVVMALCIHHASCFLYSWTRTSFSGAFTARDATVM